MKLSRPYLALLAAAIPILAQDSAPANPDKALEQLRAEIRSELRSSLDKSDEESNERLVRIEGVLIEVLPARDIASGNLARTLAGLVQIRGLSRSAKVNALATELTTHVREAIAKSQREFAEAYRPALRKALTEGLKAEKPADVDKPLAVALALKRKIGTFVDAENNQIPLVESDEVEMVVNILNPWQIGLQHAQSEPPDPFISALVIQRAEQAYDEDLSEIMPRSEMLELIAAARVRWNLDALFRADDAREVAAVKAALGKVTKMEDLPSALETISTQVSGRHPWSGRSGPVSDLNSALMELQRVYQKVKSGASSELPAMPSFSGVETAQPIAGNSIDALLADNFGQAGFQQPELPTIKVPIVFAREFGSIHQLLLRFALPRALGGAESPADSETLPAYLSRLAATSIRENDWPRLAKILDAVQHLQADGVYGPRDILALRFMLSGHNLERARQYSSAVAAYLAALQSGSQAVPAEWIGDQLEGIQKAHPEAYEAGQKRAVELSPKPLSSARSFIVPPKQ